jgi:hypothetical protein
VLPIAVKKFRKRKWRLTPGVEKFNIPKWRGGITGDSA